jgi:uncharacterized damage-inducible protein DinB
MALTPEQATFALRSLTLPVLLNEHPLTRSVIAAIPADKADYRPDPVTRSALDLAWHIASAEHRFLQAAAAGSFDYDSTRPDTVRTPADVVEWYAERFGRDIEALKEVPGERLVEKIDFRGILHFPAFVYVDIGLRHSIHHRGQLTTYLRPMGARVPSIYGESHDAREARERGEAPSR